MYNHINKKKLTQNHNVNLNKKEETVRLTHILYLLLAVLIVSCSSSSTNTPGELPDDEGFTAELGDDTKLISAHVTESALSESDEENHMYTFHADVLSDENISLNQGEILLLEGRALRRITSVNESNGVVTVETEFAALNEAFENAEVDHTYEFNFNQTVAEKVLLEFQGELLEPNKTMTKGATGWEYEMGDFKIEGTLDTEKTKAQISLLVKYDTGEVSGAMLSTATIENFRNETAFRIVDHETRSFSFNNPGLSGSLDMQFTFAGGESNEQGWEPPMPALVFPFTIGPVPVVFRMGTVYVSKIDLGVDGTAKFETSFSYSGDLGFQVEGKDFTPVLEGGIKNPGADDAEGNAAGFGGTVSGQYGIGIPKISFDILGGAVVPYLMQEYYIGASYTFPTCTRLFSRYEVNAGVNMSVFGLADLKFNQQLAETYPHDYKSEGCSSSKLADEESGLISLRNVTNYDEEITIPFRMK